MAVVTPGLSNDQHRAVCYTDFWTAYSLVLPQKRHRAVGKETGLTNHIERFNNTLRQRISRLVRQTLNLSPKKYKITSARFFCSLTITTNHYGFSTTRQRKHCF